MTATQVDKLIAVAMHQNSKISIEQAYGVVLLARPVVFELREAWAENCIKQNKIIFK